MFRLTGWLWISHFRTCRSKCFISVDWSWTLPSERNLVGFEMQWESKTYPEIFSCSLKSWQLWTHLTLRLFFFMKILRRRWRKTVIHRVGDPSGQLSGVVLTKSRTHPQGGVGIIVSVVWVTGRCHQHLLGRDRVDSHPAVRIVSARICWETQILSNGGILVAFLKCLISCVKPVVLSFYENAVLLIKLFGTDTWLIITHSFRTGPEKMEGTAPPPY